MPLATVKKKFPKFLEIAIKIMYWGLKCGMSIFGRVNSEMINWQVRV